MGQGAADPNVLIAVDTSGKHGSLALGRVSEGRCELVEVVALAGGTFSAQLIPQLSEALAKNGFSKRNIYGFAVASGPGSFTGLRVGLAAIKGLAEALQKPIAAVSMLEVIARSGTARGDVWAAMDAGRGEVYLGRYEVAEPAGPPPTELVVPREECAEKVGDVQVITADGNVAEVLRTAGRHVEVIPYPGSAGVARFGWEKMRGGQVVSPEDLEANYIRRSDAEIFFKPTAGL